MPAVTKADLIQHLFAVAGINKREAKEVVDIFFEEIVAALAQGEAVKLPGFGVFTPKSKVPREGRNPKTGKSVIITERLVTTFKPANTFRVKIQAYSKSAKQTKTAH